MSNQLTPEEYSRYHRHIILPEFGEEGQLKLKNSRVLVVGTGGLGAPVLNYLAASGVGTIGIVDFDRVEDSNLQRQVLFNTDDIGEYKTVSAKHRLTKLNPHVKFVEHNLKLDRHNALAIIKDYDVVADGTDNFATRYLVNDACVILGKVNVFASVLKFNGQLSVFNYRSSDGITGPNYRDVFPTPPKAGTVPSCAEGGVLGVLPGILGSLQANEVIKVCADIGEVCSGRLLMIDALTLQIQSLKITKSEESAIIKELIDYEEFCGVGKAVLADQLDGIKELSNAELKNWISNNKDFQLIDVREVHEYNGGNMSADLIPLGTLVDQLDLISREKPVVVHCQSGMRSKRAIELLQNEHGYSNLWNLTEGYLGFKNT